jgi:hypothetical protein
MAKCSECGFLALRNRKNNNLDEADSDFRKKGMVTQVWDDQGRNPHRLYRDIPLCFAGSKYLSEQLNNLTEPNNPFKQVSLVITKETDCKKFIDWLQGFTPKEHKEMIDEQWKLKQETERRKNDRKWHWVELLVITIMAGLFTLLGAWINSLS